MKRGDVFVWVSRFTGVRVPREEELWSSVDRIYVPAGEVNVVLEVRGDSVTWWSPQGTFTTWKRDNVGLGINGTSRWLVPRTIG